MGKKYNSEKRKLWYASRDEEWKEKNRALARARRTKIQEFINEYKVSTGCKDCGYNAHHVALDFDHITGEKELNVCNAKSIEQAKKEMEKCEVVCACCHRIRTYNRLQPCAPDVFEKTYEAV